MTLAEDRDAIRDLFARYCLHIDAGEADAWAATFTEDGTFETGGDPMVGTEALRAFAGSLPADTMHHMVLNEAIDVDGDRATARSSIMVLSGGQVATAGRYQDELRRVDGAWRIARRHFTPDTRS